MPVKMAGNFLGPVLRDPRKIAPFSNSLKGNPLIALGYSF